MIFLMLPCCILLQYIHISWIYCGRRPQTNTSHPVEYHLQYATERDVNRCKMSTVRWNDQKKTQNNCRETLDDNKTLSTTHKRHTVTTEKKMQNNQQEIDVRKKQKETHYNPIRNAKQFNRHEMATCAKPLPTGDTKWLHTCKQLQKDTQNDPKETRRLQVGTGEMMREARSYMQRGVGLFCTFVPYCRSVSRVQVDCLVETRLSQDNPDYTIGVIFWAFL